MDNLLSLSSCSKTAEGSTSLDAVNTSCYQRYELLYKAVRSGDLDAVKSFLNNHQEAVNARITSSGKTALQIAAMFGHLHIVEELVQLMSVDDLELVDADHSTALHDATSKRNNIKVAKCIVEKNKKLVTIHTNQGWIPVTLALKFGHTDLARYLYFITPLELLLPENSDHGATLLGQCYYTKMLDVALDLLKHCPRLAVTTPRNPQGPTFLEALATMPSAFLNENQLPYWKRWMYKYVHVEEEPGSSIDEICFSIPETTTVKSDYVIRTSPGRMHQMVSNTLNLLGIKSVHEAKLAHKQYLELLRVVCNVISTLNEQEIKEREILSSVLLAAQRGNPEFIVEAIKVHLPLVWSRNSKGRNIFFLAVQFRQVKVFNLIHGVYLKDGLANTKDFDGNYLLHAAGMLAPSSYLNQISGAVLQMQRELQWFKEVESIMLSMGKESLNIDNMTPRDLFTKNHKDLVKEGERWMKETASSCTIVAALVATITFAAAFTVPGGNDQNTGYPMFLQQKLFMLFIISDAVSFFSSSTSVLIFLGLLTSRYAEDDFLKSLPTKLVIGLSTLFICIATMMLAFCAAIFTMLRDKSWIVIPVTLFACAPIALYVWLQFPLLVEIFMSTYGPGIFDGNVQPWP